MIGMGLLGFWLLLVLIVAGALALGMIWLADRTLSDSVGQENNSALSPFLSCVALVFGALLGFTVVVAWGQFSAAETHVSQEASTLTTMYRQTVAMPAPEQTQLRQLLRKYTDAVKGPEWARVDEGGTSGAARSAITQMYVIVGNPESSAASRPINQEFPGPVDDSDVRPQSALLGCPPPNTGVVVGRSALRCRRGGGSVRFHAPGQQTRSRYPLERGRRTARLADVPCLLARPSVRDAAGYYIRTVPKGPERFRRDRPGDIVPTRWFGLVSVDATHRSTRGRYSDVRSSSPPAADGTARRSPARPTAARPFRRHRKRRPRCRSRRSPRLWVRCRTGRCSCPSAPIGT